MGTNGGYGGEAGGGYERERWHLDKRIPIATLVTLIVVVVGGVLHIAEIRKDVELLREQQRAMTERMDRQDTANHSIMGDLKDAIKRLDGKMDRLLERQGGAR